MSIHDTRLNQTVSTVANFRGDVVALLSATGETVAEWERGPFGEPLLATASSEANQAWLDACRRYVEKLSVISPMPNPQHSRRHHRERPRKLIGVGIEHLGEQGGFG